MYKIILLLALLFTYSYSLNQFVDGGDIWMNGHTSPIKKIENDETFQFHFTLDIPERLDPSKVSIEYRLRDDVKQIWRSLRTQDFFPANPTFWANVTDVENIGGHKDLQNGTYEFYSGHIYPKDLLDLESVIDNLVVRVRYNYGIKTGLGIVELNYFNYGSTVFSNFCSKKAVLRGHFVDLGPEFSEDYGDWGRLTVYHNGYTWHENDQTGTIEYQNIELLDWSVARIQKDQNVSLPVDLDKEFNFRLFSVGQDNEAIPTSDNRRDNFFMNSKFVNIRAFFVPDMSEGESFKDRIYSNLRRSDYLNMDVEQTMLNWNRYLHDPAKASIDPRNYYLYNTVVAWANDIESIDKHLWYSGGVGPVQGHQDWYPANGTGAQTASVLIAPKKLTLRKVFEGIKENPNYDPKLPNSGHFIEVTFRDCLEYLETIGWSTWETPGEPDNILRSPNRYYIWLPYLDLNKEPISAETRRVKE